jgi:hypothetical protein
MTSVSLKRVFTLTGLAAVLMAASAHAQEAPAITLEDVPRNIQSQVTDVWEPVPPTVDAPEGGIPSDAIVLFDGSGTDAWVKAAEGGGAVDWPVEDGVLSIGSRDIVTAESFCDVQMHIEWRSPVETAGFDGQDRGNSGIKFQRRYEVQILDSVDNPTYVHGQAASVYKQYAPLVNASRAPGEWQTYDIVFESPIFDEDSGALRKPAYITVFHNGVLVQNHVQLSGTTSYVGYPTYTQHGCEPILLQDHASDVTFRNIWVRPL